MKGYGLTVLAALLILLINPQSVLACEQWQQKADRYTVLKRQGGSAKQMNRWHQRKKLYSERYLECRRQHPQISVAQGTPRLQSGPTVDRQPLRASASNNPILQKQLATCNYWIATYNRQPTADNQAFRASACRALDEMERHEPMPPTLSQTQRPVRECIKAGNVVDDEVVACMRGEQVPDWQQ